MLFKWTGCTSTKLNERCEVRIGGGVGNKHFGLVRAYSYPGFLENIRLSRGLERDGREGEGRLACQRTITPGERGMRVGT
jgi:hypothetical protein